MKLNEVFFGMSDSGRFLLKVRVFLLVCLFAVLFGAFFPHSVYAESYYASMQRYVNDVELGAFGGSMVTTNDKVTVNTNCPAGYNFYVTTTETGDTSLSLLDKSDSIPISANAIGHEATLSSNSWGVGTNDSAFAGVQEYNAALTPLYVGSGNKDYYVYYGASVPFDKKPGVYSGEVLYTLMMNEACLRYTLSFDANGATFSTLPTGSDRPSINFGSKVDLSQYSATDKIAKTGYHLTGWNVKDGSDTVIYTDLPTDSNVVIDDGLSSVITLVAQWVANNYEVVYDAGTTGGTCSVTSTPAVYGQDVTLSSTKCTKTGHTQDGWSVNSDGSTKDYDLGEALTKPNFTSTNNGTYNLYPHYVINSHNVIINKGANVTTVSGAGSHDYGASVNISATAFITGYHFDSWTVDSGEITLSSTTTSPATFTMPDTNVTLTANAAVNNYTVAYVTGTTGGTCSVTSTPAVYGQDVTLSSTKCTKTGHTQDGWSVNSDGSTKDYDLGEALTKPNFTSTNNGTYNLYPHFIEAYTVTINKGTNVTTVSGAGTYGVGDTVTISATAFSTGYKFSSWTVNSGGVTLSSTTTSPATFTMPRGNVTITANAVVRSYTLTISNGNTTAISSVSPASGSKNYGTSVTAKCTPKTGYHCTGWTSSSTSLLSSSSNASYTFTMPAGNVKLTAKGAINSFTLAYNANGSIGSVSSQTVQYGSTVTLRANGFTVPGGMEFKEWNTKADGTGTSYTASQAGVAAATLKSNIATVHGGTVTLYAIWNGTPAAMQDFNCSTDLTTDNIAVLADTRDNSLYAVKKFSNGSCWMIQNLKLGYDKGYAMTKADTNIPDTDNNTYYIPKAGFQGTDVITTDSRNSTTTANFSSSNDNRAKVKYKAASSSTASQDTGYYSFYTASLGFAYNRSGTSGYSPRDICPKGWELPGRTYSWGTLYSLVGGSVTKMVTGSHMGYYGITTGTSFSGGDFFSRFLTSYASTKTTSSSSQDNYTEVFYMQTGPDSVKTSQDSTIYHGYPVRCVAK